MEGSKALMERAREAARTAYAPYSAFRVGAAVLCDSGEVYAGCNVENASYGLTICAERNAVGAMVEGGETVVEAVAVFSPDAAPALPCGACRQVLREFGCPDVIVVGRDGELRRYRFEELLPEAFGPEDLR